MLIIDKNCDIEVRHDYGRTNIYHEFRSFEQRMANYEVNITLTRGQIKTLQRAKKQLEPGIIDRILNFFRR